MRFVSTGASPPSAGFTILPCLEGGGLSGGLGCVRVNGNSTDKSLFLNKILIIINISKQELSVSVIYSPGSDTKEAFFYMYLYPIY